MVSPLFGKFQASGIVTHNFGTHKRHFPKSRRMIRNVSAPKPHRVPARARPVVEHREGRPSHSSEDPIDPIFSQIPRIEMGGIGEMDFNQLRKDALPFPFVGSIGVDFMTFPIQSFDPTALVRVQNVETRLSLSLQIEVAHQGKTKISGIRFGSLNISAYIFLHFFISKGG